MARQKSRKTALKRLKKTNPKGKRKPKLIYNESGQHHMKTKRSKKSKRRKTTSAVVDATIVKKYKKLINI